MKQIDINKIERNIGRSDRVFKIAFVLMMGFIVATLISIVIQLSFVILTQQTNLKNALRISDQQHLRIQQYIRCISLLPVDQRTPEDFDLCGKTGDVVTGPNQEVH